MSFDPSGAYDNTLIMADSDPNNNNKTAIYQLLPDLSWETLASPVSTSTRFYGDGGLAISSGGDFGQTLYVTELHSGAIMAVDSEGMHTEFASGFTVPSPSGGGSRVFSITIDEAGNSMFVADDDGIYRIHAHNGEAGPTLVMREPWVRADDVHTGPSGVDALRLLWSECILFDHDDVSVANEDDEPISFSLSGSNSQFMIISFGETLLNDKYTITIHDSVAGCESNASIDGDNDGCAGGNAVLIIEHRNQFDADRDGNVDLYDFGVFDLWFCGPVVLSGTPCPE